MSVLFKIIYTFNAILIKMLPGFFVCVCLFRAAPMAYGGSQARGLIRATVAGLHQSPSNTRSEPRQQPTPQLTAMPDPQPTEQGQGSNPQPMVPSWIR